MIDYNYYSQLNDKDLDKIVCHIKNIQNLRQNDFENHFFNADIEKVSSSLPNINKNKLEKTFNTYIDSFNDSEKNLNFYLFLKTNEQTKILDFSNLEKKLCWNFPNIKNLETIKNTLPETFNSFKSYSFQYHDEDIITYLHNNNFIDFNSMKTHTTSDAMMSYMVKNNMFESFNEFPLSKWFRTMSEEVLSQVRSHFNLPKFNLEQVYHDMSSLHQGHSGYMKDSVKYKSPDFLENFVINPYFVQEFSKTIDKVSDNEKPLDFILKMYELIQLQPQEDQQHLVSLLNSEVKKPKNKELMAKIQMNFNMNNYLPEKNIKSPSFKI